MYSKLPPEHIRLLAISPDTDTITLTVKHIDDEPYEALSYTWGSPICSKENEWAYDHTEDVTLIVGGEKHVIEVTRNLYEALDELSSAQHLIWIDAICINQEDLEEKSQQVAFMAEIYTRATVLVWLGIDDGTYNQLYHIHTEILDKIVKSKPRHRDIRIEGSVAVFASAGLRFDATSLLQLYATRRWINRAWVTQEILLAKDVVVIQPRLQFSRLAEMAYLLSRGVFLRELTVEANGSLGVGLELSWLRRWSAGFESDGDDVIAEAMPDYFSQMFFFLRCPRQATIPDDIIYSLHSMVAHRTRPEISVDYSKPIFEFFTVASFKYSLQALSFCRMKDGDESERPSWLPDYASLPLPYVPDDASWPMVPHLAVARTGKQIQVYGRKIMGIASAIGLRRDENTKEAGMSRCIEAFDFYRGDYSQFQQLMTMRLGDMNIPFENGVWLSIVTAARHTPELLERYITAAQRLSVGIDFNHIAAVARDCLNPVHDRMIIAWFEDKEDDVWRGEFADSSHLFHGFELYGRCEGPVAVGDEVWILHGARPPFVLRPSGKSYKIVCEAFVPKIMTGGVLPPEVAAIAGDLTQITII